MDRNLNHWIHENTVHLAFGGRLKIKNIESTIESADTNFLLYSFPLKFLLVQVPKANRIPRKKY